MRQALLRASAKVAVSTLGGALVVVGAALLFLPGPGILVLLAGVALLAREYRWARRARDLLLERIEYLRDRARRRRIPSRVVGGPPAAPADTPGPLGTGASRDDLPAA
jgi:hypothetical protein